MSDWNVGKFRAIENFTAACIEFNLPFEIDSPQISTFIDRLDECFYAPSTLDCQWGTLRQVAKELNFEINHEHLMHYKAVKADCREVTDCRIPVSRELLIEMCNAALEIFTGYTACLARALFICAWAFSMRISEYSSVSLWKKPTDKEDKSHNIRYYAIRVSSHGLSVRFISDKTAKAGDPIKHRTISWKLLPDFAKGVMKCYEILRKGPTYFCMEDGQPLDRNAVLNLMEPCLLHTSWCHLAMTAHSWRQGRASTEFNEGRPINDIKYDCRWTESSKAFDTYCRTDLVTMRPHEIFEQFPQSRKVWHDAGLVFISNKLIMTAGEVPGHPHHTVLVDEFHDQ